MDPLSAIGLAGAVVQFVSFSHEIVSLGKEIYKSPIGAIQESIEIGVILKDLSALHQSLHYSWERSHKENALFSLVEKCEPIHKELENVLQRLEVQGSHRKWKSLRAAVKLAWKEGDINDLEKRLRRLQCQIDSHLVSDIKSQQAATMKLLQDMAETSRRLEINRAVELQHLQSDIKKGFDTLRTSKKSSHTIKHSGVTVAEPARLEVPSSPSNIHGRLDDNPLSSLGPQAHQAQTYIAECKIIQNLGFQGMPYRQCVIKEAHLATFEWIFSYGQRPSPVHFTEWLLNGDGIFWISGRPGSGKSTLMKYIYGNSRTINLLSEWAGTSNLVPACFYFWSVGTPMQKSIQGLLQSLVCQVLRQCPSLIPAAFPREWKNLIEGNRVGYFDVPDLVGLTRAIESFTKAKNLNTKFCFFIDGLDEYEGFDRNIATTIRTLASSPSVKICVASRPHNIFVNAFGGSPDRMLYVHEFTDWDIRRYIQDVLEENPAFVSRKEQDPQGYQELAEYVRKEANGVFLWVYLVVVRILDGMENADRMSDLQKKLEKAPTDLKSLFTHILNSVGQDYHEQQAQMLQIACQADGPLNLIAYSFLDEEDPYFAFHCPVEPMDDDIISRRCEDMKKRVVARCKLLLEVVERPHANPYFRQHVTFLHRTVRDYLRDAEALQLLTSRLNTPFDSNTKVCDALLAQIKTVYTDISASSEVNGPLHHLVVQLLRHAKVFEESNQAPLASHLNSLRSAMEILGGKKFSWWRTPTKVEFDAMEFDDMEFDDITVPFLELIIGFGLSAYLKYSFDSVTNDHRLSPLQLASLLSTTLLGECPSNSEVELRTETLKVLLQHGADPNHSFKDRSTPWVRFLGALNETRNGGGGNSDLWEERFLVVERLVLAGADVDIVHYPLGWTEGHTVAVEEIIKALPFVSVGYLLDLIEQMRQLQRQLQRIQKQQKQQKNGLLGWLRWR